MKVNRPLGLLATIVVICGLFALGDSALAAAKANHHNGQQLLGAKLKTNGPHVINKKGNYTASVEVKNGKVAGVHVKHGKKGDVPVRKYKTNKKMGQAGGHFMHASLLSAQDQYVGTLWIGYAYVDEYGYEEIYWFPYDMILDGDTGAIWFVPA
jgi:uncharacterized protein with FMN-binding domain